MRFTHLPETEAGQPPQTIRNGCPFIHGMSSPFIAKASSDSSSSAFFIGTPREIGSFFGSPDK